MNNKQFVIVSCWVNVCKVREEYYYSGKHNLLVTFKWADIWIPELQFLEKRWDKGAFNKSQGSLMPRISTKHRGPNNLSHLTFSVTSLFFSLIRRGFKIQQILRKLRKLGAATICRILRFFVTFLLFLYLPDGASEFNKFWENCEKSWSQRFAALYDFSSLLCCS